MLRVVLLNATFFLLPFAVYAAWLLMSRGSMTQAGAWPARTIAYLALGGIVLTVGALIAFIHFTDAPPTAEYRPATIDENGRIVPGTLQ